MQTFPPIPDWISLEHKVAEILTNQELYGWHFNEREAHRLESILRSELEDLTQVLRGKHPLIAGSEFTPRRNNSENGNVIIDYYLNGENESEVTLFIILNGGHSWPSSNNDPTENEELNGTKIIWDFFESRPKQ